MTRDDAIKLLGSIAEAINLLSSTEGEKTSEEEKPKKNRKLKKEEPKKEEEVKKEGPGEDDFFGDDDAEVVVRTPEEVKTLVIKWIGESPDARRKVAQKTFEEVTGLEKMNEVTAENATEVYGKLEAAFKK